MTTYKQDEIKDILTDLVLEIVRKGVYFTATDFKYIMETTPNKIIDKIKELDDERIPF